ncbi:hypothetical protein CA830_28590, partial [Burkholderia multivorans]
MAFRAMRAARPARAPARPMVNDRMMLSDLTRRVARPRRRTLAVAACMWLAAVPSLSVVAPSAAWAASDTPSSATAGSSPAASAAPAASRPHAET